MSHRGGPFKTRSGKAETGVADKSGNTAPLASSSDPSRSRKGADPATGEATSSSDEFLFIRALSQMGSSSSAQLVVVQRLLKSVLSAAGNVIRGTDSQRKFTSLYTEFCISAVRSLASVEEAVYELTHPGCRAADAADWEIQGIDDADFLKQVAVYVATHTSALSVAYLEHVGQSAFEKLQKQQRKRERSATTSSGSADASSHRAAKASRTVVARGAGAQAAHGGGASVDKPGHSPFGSLGLVDAQETMRHALQAIERDKQASASTPADAAGVSRRGHQDIATAQLELRYTDARPSGVFLSKAPGGLSAIGATSDGTPLDNCTIAYDLRDPDLKLSSIPELSTRLQPWTIPLPSSGVYLDRVTMERDRRGGNASGNGTCVSTARVEPTKSALEVCLAPTPIEFLRQWEIREAALATEQQQPSSAPVSVSGPYSVAPYGGSSSRAGGLSTGGSPRPTAPLPTPPPSAPSNSSPLGHHPPCIPELDARTSGADVDPTLVFSDFFPAVRDKLTTTSMPTYVMANLSHYGVSKMEHVYAMGSTSK
nr:unnamed protein product [Leishmania braziliensis]